MLIKPYSHLRVSKKQTGRKAVSVRATPKGPVLSSVIQRNAARSHFLYQRNKIRNNKHFLKCTIYISTLLFPKAAWHPQQAPSRPHLWWWWWCDRQALSGLLTQRGMSHRKEADERANLIGLQLIKSNEANSIGHFYFVAVWEHGRGLSVLRVRLAWWAGDMHKIIYDFWCIRRKI